MSDPALTQHVSLAMTTADWALIISLCSFLISLAGFVWNVWSKFIYPKPKVRVAFYASSILQQGQTQHRLLTLSATNFDSGTVTLHMTIGRARKSHFKRLQHLILNPLHDIPMRYDLTVEPFSGGLPKKLDVGDDFSSHFVLLHEGFRDENIE